MDLTLKVPREKGDHQFAHFNNVLEAWKLLATGSSPQRKCLYILTDGFVASAVCQLPFQSLAKFMASLHWITLVDILECKDKVVCSKHYNSVH